MNKKISLAFCANLISVSVSAMLRPLVVRSLRVSYSLQPFCVQQRDKSSLGGALFCTGAAVALAGTTVGVGVLGASVFGVEVPFDVEDLAFKGLFGGAMGLPLMATGSIVLMMGENNYSNTQKNKYTEIENIKERVTKLEKHIVEKRKCDE